MKANPDKFQAICVGKKAHGNIGSFQMVKQLLNVVKMLPY